MIETPDEVLADLVAKHGKKMANVIWRNMQADAPIRHPISRAVNAGWYSGNGEEDSRAPVGRAWRGRTIGNAMSTRSRRYA